jgi:pentatricopeptide repeat protein
MVRGAASRWPAAARIAFTPANTPQGRYNPLILRAAEQGNLAKALNLARQLRELSPVPSLETYEALAKAFAVHGLSREALRVIDDAEAAGITPDVEVWNQVLSVRVIYSTRLVTYQAEDGPI